jgi:hypothetical protein
MAQLQNLQNPFLSTTQIFDVSDVRSMKVESPEFKELIIRLVMDANEKSIAINSKAIGNYDTLEQLSGKTYPPTSGQTPRNSYFKIINFGALPGSSTTKSIAHGITITAGSSFSVVNVYGAATNPTTMNFIPLPYSHPNAAVYAIALNADGTNVNITTGTNNWSAYTLTTVVIEYLKD